MSTSTVKRDVQDISCDLQRHLSSDTHTDTRYALQHMSPGYIYHTAQLAIIKRMLLLDRTTRGNTDNSAIERKDKRIRHLPST